MKRGALLAVYGGWLARHAYRMGVHDGIAHERRASRAGCRGAWRDASE